MQFFLHWQAIVYLAFAHNNTDVIPLYPFMPTGAFNICCPRDCVSRHNGGTSGAPLKPLRVDSALRDVCGNVCGNKYSFVHPA